ncbi:MAG: DUF58 domain-containing protein [Sphingobacteriales bacterium]|nr:DUF58 domain-containing protein [Sphingobacteriales bacterium]MBI3718548.1 DUF58 domain-containing protein [Sphingobacteriales bacterium]
MGIAAALFVCRFFIRWLGDFPFLVAGVALVLFLLEYVVLFFNDKGIFARRFTPERLSNGDENLIRINIENKYRLPVHISVIDEIPVQFQKRDAYFDLAINTDEQKIIQYYLRPVKRGEYHFGKVNVFTSLLFQLIRKRYQFEEPVMVPVYPSFLQMRKYQLMAISNRLSEVGIKKVRRIGHSMEFEQIKEYVQGDDVRTINWKATARKGQIMVNNFTDEKSQQVYCVIDKGRAMKMPFEGLSLLDYAVNASLVLLNIALLKQDKAGIITFSEKLSSFLKADKKAVQMNSILEVLYNQRTRYLESDFEKLYSLLRTKVSQRSLIVLFTNFESMSGMQRQLPFLRKIAANHLLVVVFFENTELKQLLDKPADDLESIYTKTVAEKFAYEKKLIVKELQKYGILSILTAPANVTVNTLNKYLELKARQLI